MPPLPKEARPTKIVRGDGSFEFGGQQIDYGYMPAAHTDGDLFVHVPKLNLIALGGVVSPQAWPLLDYKYRAWHGGRYGGECGGSHVPASIPHPDVPVCGGRVRPGASADDAGIGAKFVYARADLGAASHRGRHHPEDQREGGVRAGRPRVTEERVARDIFLEIPAVGRRGGPLAIGFLEP